MIEWDKLVPVALGGAISSVSAVIMFTVAQWVDRRKRKVEARKKKIDLCFLGLTKLTHTANSIENLARTLDAQIKEGTSGGKLVFDTATIIQPLIGARPRLDLLTAEEMSFLIPENHDLMAEVWEIQHRAASNDAVLEYYNAERAKFDQYLIENSQSLGLVDGAVATAKLDLKAGKIVELHLAKLNTIIVPLIVSLEEDRSTIKKVVSKYIDKAIEEFGGDFPAKKVVWKDPK